MRHQRYCFFFFLCMLLPAANATSIKICDDGAEWPPYTFYERVNGKNTQEIIGFSVDVIRQILAENNLQFTLELPPWKRCLHQLEKGDYDLALNSAYNDERAEKYILSTPYYKLTLSLFFDTKRYPQGIDVSSVDSLKKYKLCGVQGYNYANYNLSTPIQQGASDLKNLFKKLEAGFCDIALARHEVVQGFSLIGPPLYRNTITHMEMPNAKVSYFYMLISRNSAHKNQLQSAINRSIKKMRDSGQLDKLLKHWLSRNKD